MASIFKEKNAWHIRFYYRGTPYRKSLGAVSDLKARRAKQRVEARLADLKAGFLKAPADADLAEYMVRGDIITSQETVQQEESFASLKESYLDYARPRRAPSSYITEQVHLRHLEKFLGDAIDDPVSRISTADIERYLTWRRSHVSGTTANKELQTLRQLFDYATRHGLIDVNPTYAVARFKRSGRPNRYLTKAEIDDQIQHGGLSQSQIKGLRRFRYLSKEEIAEILDLARERDPWIYPVVTTLVFTGMRRREVVALEWGDVDFKRSKIWVRSRKQSNTREFSDRDIDMHEKLARVLTHRHERAQGGRYVFQGRNGGLLARDVLHRAFKALILGTDFDGIGLHCLRHSFASNLASQGVDDRLIDHYMGHQTPEMRRRYQHLFPEKKNEGIRRLPY